MILRPSIELLRRILFRIFPIACFSRLPGTKLNVLIIQFASRRIANIVTSSRKFQIRNNLEYANYRDYPKSTSTKLGLPLEYFSDLTKHSLPVQVGQRSRSPVEQTNPPEPSDPSMASESWGPQAPCRCKRSQNRWFREEVVLSPKRCKTPWPHRRCS